MWFMMSFQEALDASTMVWELRDCGVSSLGQDAGTNGYRCRLTRVPRWVYRSISILSPGALNHAPMKLDGKSRWHCSSLKLYAN
jgi:hypothetical protein